MGLESSKFHSALPATHEPGPPAAPRPALTDWLMGSPLFLTDLRTGHEREPERGPADGGTASTRGVRTRPDRSIAFEYPDAEAASRPRSGRRFMGSGNATDGGRWDDEQRLLCNAGFPTGDADWKVGDTGSRLMGRFPSRFAWGLLAVVALLMTGCASGPARPGGGRAVERLDLLLTAVALDVDGKPGADGFGARVYASNRRSSVGAVLTEGRLEIAMYDGVLSTGQLGGATPLKVWTYEARALPPFAQKTSIGTGYRFGLTWGDRMPQRERITVVARYVAPDGVVVASAPGSIPLAVK